MNRVRVMGMLALALVLGLAASFLVYQKLQQSSRAAASNYKVAAVVRNLEIGSKLGDLDVKMIDWAGSPPEGSFAKTADVIGRAVLYPTFSGEVILESKLAPVGAGAGLAAVIPDGMRAVSIRVDDVVAVAGFVGPGTHVDVLLTGQPGSRSDESITKTILENVQVLAAGEKIQPDAQGRPEKVNVVTLLCSPEDAARVTLASAEGRIQLVLRNPTDTVRAEKETWVARPSLYGKLAAPPVPQIQAKPKPKPQPKPAVIAAPPPPPPPPPTSQSIQLIRGEKVTNVEVPL